MLLLPVMPCKGPGLVQPGGEKASEEPPGIYRWIWRRQGQDLKLVDSPITIYQWRLVWSCSHFEKPLKEDALKRSTLVSASCQWVWILGRILSLLLFFDSGNPICPAWHLAWLMTESSCHCLSPLGTHSPLAACWYISEVVLLPVFQTDRTCFSLDC